MFHNWTSFQELEGITLETQTKVVSDGVGKYIGKKKLKHLESLEPQGAKRTKVLKSSVTGFRDFSAWWLKPEASDFQEICAPFTWRRKKLHYSIKDVLLGIRTWRNTQ